MLISRLTSKITNEFAMGFSDILTSQKAYCVPRHLSSLNVMKAIDFIPMLCHLTGNADSKKLEPLQRLHVLTKKNVVL